MIQNKYITKKALAGDMQKVEEHKGENEDMPQGK